MAADNVDIEGEAGDIAGNVESHDAGADGHAIGDSDDNYIGGPADKENLDILAIVLVRPEGNFLSRRNIPGHRGCWRTDVERITDKKRGCEDARDENKKDKEGLHHDWKNRVRIFFVFVFSEYYLHVRV